MEPFYGQGPRFGGGRRGLWLLPLVIGIGIGALLFGLPRGFGGGFDNDRRQSAPITVDPGRTERQPPAAAPVDTPAAAARPDFDRGFRGGDGRGRHGHGFFPFGAAGLIVPLALIGAGLWLLAGRPRPGGGNGPRNTGTPAPYAPPSTPPTPYQPDRPSTPPTTGDTRIL